MLSQKVEQIQSPPRSEALERDQLGKGVRELNPVPLNTLERPGTSRQDESNDAFSDSQFGEIADEENYKGIPEQDFGALINAEENMHEDTIVIQNHLARPTANLTGKYTSCTNKNETLTK